MDNYYDNILSSWIMTDIFPCVDIYNVLMVRTVHIADGNARISFYFGTEHLRDMAVESIIDPIERIKYKTEQYIKTNSIDAELNIVANMGCGRDKFGHYVKIKYYLPNQEYESRRTFGWNLDKDLSEEYVVAEQYTTFHISFKLDIYCDFLVNADCKFIDNDLEYYRNSSSDGLNGNGIIYYINEIRYTMRVTKPKIFIQLIDLCCTELADIIIQTENYSSCYCEEPKIKLFLVDAKKYLNRDCFNKVRIYYEHNKLRLKNNESVIIGPLK